MSCDRNLEVTAAEVEHVLKANPYPVADFAQSRLFLEVDGKNAALDLNANRVFNRGMLAGLAIEKYRALVHEILAIFIKNSLPEIRSHLVEGMDGIKTLRHAVLIPSRQLSKHQ